MDDVLVWLQRWYQARCNGDWEHLQGIRISTLDNPGWRVHIDLTETDLEGISFETQASDASQHDWVRCWVKDNVFEGAGGAQKLITILDVFRTWGVGVTGFPPGFEEARTFRAFKRSSKGLDRTGRRADRRRELVLANPGHHPFP